MRVLSVVNQKGGCGKTTTAINLSAWLALMKKNVLLVDMDPQGHATAGLNATAKTAPRDLRSALLNFYEEAVPLSQLTVSVEPRFDLIPSLLSLVALEQELTTAPNRERRLKDLLERGEGNYDYIIIDSPPNLGLLTINALTACREILIPVDTGTFALHGLRRLFHVVDLVQERMAKTHKIHILLTLYDHRVRLARTIEAELEEHFLENLLKSRIRSNIHLKEAASYGLSILDHMRNSLGAWDYRDLAEEILAQESLEVEKQDEAVVAEPPVMEEPRIEGERPREEFSDVIFQMLAPDAREVFVVGEFNNWQQDARVYLEKDERGVWTRRIPLTPGNYQYKYNIDGEWVVDPDNPLRIVNENGVINSLIKVK